MRNQLSRSGDSPPVHRCEYNAAAMVEKPKIDRSRVLLFLVAAVALASGISFNRWMGGTPGSSPPDELHTATALWNHALPIPQFTLRDSEDQPFTHRDLVGRWSLMFFGYTHCPDVCPTTLSTLDKAYRLLEAGENREPPAVVFVSVDPERDDADQLGEYVRYFNPRFRGVTGTDEALTPLTSGLGILHTRAENPNDPESYLVDHSAVVLLIAPDGRLIALFNAPHEAEAIAHDVTALRDAYTRG